MYFAFVYTTPDNAEPQVFLCEVDSYAGACMELEDFVDGEYQVHNVLGSTKPIEIEV